MIYYIDKTGKQRIVPQVKKAMEEYNRGGRDAMHNYLIACAERKEISRENAFYYEIDLMSYRWEEQ